MLHTEGCVVMVSGWEDDQATLIKLLIGKRDEAVVT
jgi:hypothetical protein